MKPEDLIVGEKYAIPCSGVSIYLGEKNNRYYFYDTRVLSFEDGIPLHGLIGLNNLNDVEVFK